LYRSILRGMEELTREIENGQPSGAVYDLIMSTNPAKLSQEQLLVFAIVARKVKATCEYAELAALAHIRDTAELAMAITVAEPAFGEAARDRLRAGRPPCPG